MSRRDRRAVDEDEQLYTIAEFLESCALNCLIDYDGFGEFATKTEVSDVTVSPSNMVRPEWRAANVPRWATHVAWYNK